MGKFQRYFTKPEEGSDGGKDKKPQGKRNAQAQEAVTYNIKKGTKPWGRKTDKFKSRKLQKSNPNPKFKGKVPIPKELLEKYGTGPGVNKKGIKTGVHQKILQHKEKIVKFSEEQSARTELILTEDPGYLEADPGETTTQFTQKQIASSVDITAASKSFDLKLDFGPYRCKYSIDGRHLLLGGKRGHVAAMDWVTKRLHCEINVMESIHDVSFLRFETMFAVAQKDWVYMYNNQGIEMHCIKKLNKVTRMEFLPNHYLLATCSEEGYLSWLDPSIGEMVSQYNSKLGRLTMMTQNPGNALLCVGHAKGVVSMWTPNHREPVVRLLSHKAPLTALHVDPRGQYMATASCNREVKIWDVRKLDDAVQEYKLVSAASHVNFSQKNMLALGMGNVVEVYRDCCATTAKRAYLRHRFVTPVQNLNFCPYEDVLGVGTAQGFTSLLSPGSGEPNFDAMEANPMQSKAQRREMEVQTLLRKIQPDLIALDPTKVTDVDAPTLRDKISAQEKLLHVKPQKIDYAPRKKAKGKGGSAAMSRNKKIVQAEAKKEFVKTVKGLITKSATQVKKEHKNAGPLTKLF